ncbi:hypothetical protein GR140_19025 [Pseudomonas putida]|uniref:hypothetical protein n=1 Tax=Pseudomonas putida TaxID=303 RepID=UPI001BB02A25|nr:hypothetical protein [Pseudomonas putida]QUG90759.1 hypothetical protein GR140_19025 [Pseudomonas putida]
MKTTKIQIIINATLFIASLAYILTTNLEPITFFLFAISICGLLAALNDMADKFKEALIVSVLSTLMLFGTLYNSKEINLAYKSDRLQPLRDAICLAKMLKPSKNEDFIKSTTTNNI